MEGNTTPAKLLVVSLLTLSFVSGYLLMASNPNNTISKGTLAYEPGSSTPGGCNTSNNYSCPAGQTCSCPEWTFDWDNNVDAGDCTCQTVPTNQVGCVHTICPVGYYCYNPGNNEATYCLPNTAPTNPPGEPTVPPGNTSTPVPPTSTPTPTVAPIAQCIDVKAYTPSWVAHSTGTLLQLRSGNQVYFCAAGSTNMGTFTKAQFTINTTQRPETTVARPGSTNEFCDLYTIPANTYNFSVTAMVYHSTLGWIQ